MPRAAEAPLKIRSYLKDATLAFDAIDVFRAARISNVLAKHNGARIALHFIVQTMVDQVCHDDRFTGEFGLVFGVWRLTYLMRKTSEFILRPSVVRAPEMRNFYVC